MPEAIIVAICSAWTETVKLNSLIWSSLTKEQQQKIVNWYIEDMTNYRDFWKKVADTFKVVTP